MPHRSPLLLTPVGFFSMPVGILGLGLSWRAAIHLWALPAAAPEIILAIGIAVWLAVSLLYIGKWLFHREAALEEFANPVQCCFLGLAGVDTLLTGIAAQPYSHLLASLLVLSGAAGTLGFALYRTGRLWMGGRDLGAITAVLYLPTVAGGFVTGIAASALGWRDWGQLSFGAGLFSWLALESVLFGRLILGPQTPPPLRPTLGIQLAPPAVGALTYLSVGSGAPDLFVQILIGYALLQALVLLRLWNWFAEQPFTPGYWGFSFGAASLSSAVTRLALKGAEVERALAVPVFAGANLLIGALFILTFRLLLQGRLFPAPPLPAPNLTPGE